VTKIESAVGSFDQELRAGVNGLHEQVMDWLVKVEQISSPSARRGQGDDAGYPTGNSPRQPLEENLSTTPVPRAHSVAAIKSEIGKVADVSSVYEEADRSRPRV